MESEFRRFSEAYKSDRGDYNSRGNTFGPTIGGSGWNRCRQEPYPFGYPTFVGASPQTAGVHPPPSAESFVGKRIEIDVSNPCAPANTRLSWQDPDQPLSYLNVRVSYAPMAGFPQKNDCVPFDYLNPSKAPCNNLGCS